MKKFNIKENMSVWDYVIGVYLAFFVVIIWLGFLMLPLILSELLNDERWFFGFIITLPVSTALLIKLTD